MFTGIVTDLGSLRAIEQQADARFLFDTGYETGEIAIGASIACSGACLTVVDKGDGWFAADVSGETLSKTTLGGWQAGTPVNFERALRLGDELGGHLVSGHVDGVAAVVARQAEQGSLRFTFEAPAELAKFIAPKGSVALDGVSLTVNEVDGRRFGINLIPHTAEATTLGGKQPGDRVNLEIDQLARYVQRLLDGRH
ncbi:riboflavin synthase [Pelagibius litoralis]|uniref:Riboflavin synthase n=1 Tax=Pelagibius litoralis TaxID=374515 RepID=A0A967EUY8_9PROT|nr:riboflavin synthase [Pelagibius litoralis]NIA67039.1 riboflavin synthase [Pelagibius litoralis]